VVDLFAADGSTAYLSLNQGTENVKDGMPPLRKRALDIRAAADLASAPAIRVDLRSAVLRPRKYGGGSSRRCARRLPLQAIPPGPRQPRRPPSSLPLA
jgi:hypothetical protein